MKRFIALALISLSLVRADPPTPQLVTFFDRSEGIFGMWWVSAGSEYNYILEVNEDDGWGWFEVAIWKAPPRGAVMSGYTITAGNAIGRVRVERVEPQPSPRGILDWKFLSPVRF
tara:strand:+ start:321 stop:665 length:345 start_codon:yes stop_codon:yes gene_type:complete